jgi:hypothetical protein
MTWSICYGKEAAQHTMVIKSLHGVRMHNQLQKYQSSKLINDISIVKSLIQFWREICKIFK